MATKTSTHLASTEKLIRTITGSNKTNFMLVPGLLGRMHLPHHGFSFDGTDDEGFALLFLQGNFTDSYYVKSLPMDEVTAQIKATVGRKTSTILCPSLESMLAVTSAKAFKELIGEGNEILQKKPNHLVVDPEVFLMTDVMANVGAGALATTFVEWVRSDTDQDDEETAEARVKFGAGGETLLAMLWASVLNLCDCHSS